MNMYVGNLSYSVTEDELRSMFTEYGDVVSAKLIMDRETGRSDTGAKRFDLHVDGLPVYNHNE